MMDDGALELAWALDTALESGLDIGNGSPLDSGAAAIPPPPVRENGDVQTPKQNGVWTSMQFVK